MSKIKRFIGLGLSVISVSVIADNEEGDIRFTNISEIDEVGINYQREPSLSNELWKQIRSKELFTPSDMVNSPTKSRGMPGIATLDYDNDGDMDIYVTNGPGVENSLYENQFSKTGKITFKDVAHKAGVGAKDMDSSGVCFGDIDNDGDRDIYVLGKGMSNELFVNKGDGTFINKTLESGLGAGENASSTCSFGDVNGDGLIDLVIGNLFYGTEITKAPIVLPDFQHLLQHNQLFINQGNNQFVNKSEESGILNTEVGISWSVALVDYDIDGDLDLVVADDHGAKRPAYLGGKDFGKMRMYANNGKGKFTEVTERMNGGRFGAWMSLSFGDLNSDGNMDIFGSNIGSYMAMFMQPFVLYPVEPDRWETGWFLGQSDGGFKFQNNPENLKALPFGWGSAITDYDNDGDLDIIYHGGLDMGMFVDAGNPGSVLNNNGEAEFERDDHALNTNHSKRNVQGVAVADLNNDGFIDILSVSNMDWPEAAPLVPYFSNNDLLLGGEFDEDAQYMPTFTPVNPVDPMDGATWNGIEQDNGTLSIEISSADNENRSAQFRLLGTKGLSSRGSVNRDGLGAVIMFKPHDENVVMSPVVSGGTYASQHSLVKTM